MRNLRTQLLATAATLALAGHAYAADMAVKAPPAPAPLAPLNEWTGAYIGLQGGWAWLDGSCSQSNNSPFSSDIIPCSTNPSANANSGIAGLRVGYDWQAGNWVLGVVGDWNWTQLKFDQFFTSNPFEEGSEGHASATIDSIPSIRARLGWAFGNTLVYATGGVAWARTEVNASVNDTCCGNWNNTNTTTLTGAVAGGGIEYKLTQHISVFGEGLWYGGFGTASQTKVCHVGQCFGSTQTYTTSFKVNDVVAALAGINFRW